MLVKPRVYFCFDPSRNVFKNRWDCKNTLSVQLRYYKIIQVDGRFFGTFCTAQEVMINYGEHRI